MTTREPASAPLRVKALMEAHEKVAIAQREVEARLDRLGVLGGSEEYTFRVSCALVAEMVGGACHPSEGGLSPSVLTPDGRAIAVWETHDHLRRSLLARETDGADEVAIVSWESRQPVAVHFVSTDDLMPMLGALATTKTPHGYAIDHGLYARITDEPLISQVYGVRTVSLDMGSEDYADLVAEQGVS